MRGNDEVVEISTGHDLIQGRYERFNTKLGQGAFKTVYKAFDTVEQISCAWNCIDLSCVQSDLEREKIFKECEILRKLQHPNIIKIGDKWYNEKNNHLNFITNIVNDGSLSKYFQNRSINVTRIKKIAKQILSALVYLHSNNIIHRDLKGDNIFIEGNTGNVVIGDLGLSCNALSARSIVGTPHFMAPELFQEQYDEMVDIWSFGMVILELVTKQTPYAECKGAFQAYQNITTGQKPLILTQITNNYIRYFIDICLNTNARLRPTALELLNHPFLTSDRISDAVLCHKSVKHKNEQYPEPQPQTSDKPEEKEKEISLMSNTAKVIVEDVEETDGRIYEISMKIYGNSFHNDDKIMTVRFSYDDVSDDPHSVSLEMVSALELNTEFVHKIENAIIQAIQKLQRKKEKEIEIEVSPSRSPSRSAYDLIQLNDASAVHRALSKESIKLKQKRETEVWLTENGLNELIATFHEQSLTMQHLRDITDDMIKEMCDQFRWNIVTRLKLKKAVQDIDAISPRVGARSPRDAIHRITAQQTQLLDILNHKHQIVCLDIKHIKDAMHDLEQSAKECNEGIRQNAHKMMTLIEQYKDKWLKQIENVKQQRSIKLELALNRLNEINEGINTAQQLCGQIAINNDMFPLSKFDDIKQIISKYQQEEQSFNAEQIDKSNYKLLLNLNVESFIQTLQNSISVEFDQNISFPLMYNNDIIINNVMISNENKSEEEEKEQSALIEIDKIKLDFNEKDFVHHTWHKKNKALLLPNKEHRRSQSANVLLDETPPMTPIKRRKTCRIIEDKYKWDALLVDGYIRTHTQCFGINVPNFIYSTCWNLYHVKCTLLKFSKIYKSTEGWRFYEGQTCIKRMKVAATEDIDDVDEDIDSQIKQRHYKWILADINLYLNGYRSMVKDKAFIGVMCWRIWIRNPNKGSIVIGVCRQRMFKSGNEHKNMVYGICMAKNRWYPMNETTDHNKIDVCHTFHQTECQIDMKLNCIKGHLSFCILNRFKKENDNQMEAKITGLPLDKHRTSWVPYFNSHKNSVGSQLKVALCPLSWYGRYLTDIF